MEEFLQNHPNAKKVSADFGLGTGLCYREIKVSKPIRSRHKIDFIQQPLQYDGRIFSLTKDYLQEKCLLTLMKNNYTAEMQVNVSTSTVGDFKTGKYSVAKHNIYVTRGPVDGKLYYYFIQIDTYWFPVGPRYFNVVNPEQFRVCTDPLLDTHFSVRRKYHKIGKLLILKLLERQTDGPLADALRGAVHHPHLLIHIIKTQKLIIRPNGRFWFGISPKQPTSNEILNWPIKIGSNLVKHKNTNTALLHKAVFNSWCERAMLKSE